jgi:hypothetical protein
MGKAMTRLRHFNVFGGPLGGTLRRVRVGVTTYRHVGRSRPGSPVFTYVLVEEPGGTFAFVPEDDECSRQAFLSASGEPGDRETETLSAEIQRRGLDF